MILRDEASVGFLDGPGRREAAGHYEAAVVVMVHGGSGITGCSVMAVMPPLFKLIPPVVDWRGRGTEAACCVKLIFYFF